MLCLLCRRACAGLLCSHDCHHAQQHAAQPGLHPRQQAAEQHAAGHAAHPPVCGGLRGGRARGGGGGQCWRCCPASSCAADVGGRGGRLSRAASVSRASVTRPNRSIPHSSELLPAIWNCRTIPRWWRQLWQTCRPWWSATLPATRMCSRSGSSRDSRWAVVWGWLGGRAGGKPGLGRGWTAVQ